MTTITLPDGFLETIVAELDDPDIIGIALGGSYNRGEATQYSDLDLALVVPGDDLLKPKRLEYRDGLLVSIATKSLEGAYADMQKPARAIWAVPGLRGCSILLDKDSSLDKLMKDLEAFRWEPLQDKANRFASVQMMIGAEGVHKILSEVTGSNQLAIAFTATLLFLGLTEIIAVQRGIMVKSDHTYFTQVEESVGIDSAWTSYHRIAAGVTNTSSGLPRTIEQRAAVLGLYAETLQLLGPIMLPEHLSVATHAARIAEKARLRGVSRT